MASSSSSSSSETKELQGKVATLTAKTKTLTAKAAQNSELREKLNILALNRQAIEAATSVENKVSDAAQIEQTTGTQTPVASKLPNAKHTVTSSQPADLLETLEQLEGDQGTPHHQDDQSSPASPPSVDITEDDLELISVQVLCSPIRRSKLTCVCDAQYMSVGKLRHR